MSSKWFRNSKILVSSKYGVPDMPKKGIIRGVVAILIIISLSTGVNLDVSTLILEIDGESFAEKEESLTNFGIDEGRDWLLIFDIRYSS